MYRPEVFDSVGLDTVRLEEGGDFCPQLSADTHSSIPLDRLPSTRRVAAARGLRTSTNSEHKKTDIGSPPGEGYMKAAPSEPRAAAVSLNVS